MKRLILWLVSRYALDILEDAYDIGFVDGYKAGLEDQDGEWVRLDELKVGGTD